MSRPLVSRPYVGAWLVFLYTAYVGHSSYLGFLGLEFSREEVNGTVEFVLASTPDDRLGVNYYVYHYAAEAVLAGEDFYNAPPPGESDFYTFLYPPITTLVWLPSTLLDPFTAYLLHTAITVVACVAATVAIAAYLERFEVTLGWLDLALVVAFFVLGTHSTGTFNFGNVNLLLAAGIVFGFLAFERGRETVGGALFGLVALVKVFPALVGLYLLRLRSWRAIGAAIATGGGGLVASAIVFGPRSVYRFFFEVLFPRGDTLSFVGGYEPDDTYYVTIQRPLSHLIWEGALPRLTIHPDSVALAPLLPILAALVLGSVVAYCYVDVESDLDRLVAIHATLVATVVFLPALRWYLVLVFFSWISLLYVYGGGPASPERGIAVLAGVAVAGLAYSRFGATIWEHWPLVVLAGLVAVGLLYAWYEDPVGVLLVLGGLVAAVTNRPSGMVARAGNYPGPLSTVFEPLFAIATLQLYGLLLTLAACIVYNYRAGVDLARLQATARALPGEIRLAVGELRAIAAAARRRLAARIDRLE